MSFTEEIVIKSNAVVNSPFYIETPGITANSKTTF